MLKKMYLNHIIKLNMLKIKIKLDDITVVKCTEYKLFYTYIYKLCTHTYIYIFNLDFTK